MSYGRTGLILRQWVERRGRLVVVWQSYAFDVGVYTTAKEEVIRVLKFENEWRAMLCEARMSRTKWESRERYWERYFTKHKELALLPDPNAWTVYLFGGIILGLLLLTVWFQYR